MTIETDTRFRAIVAKILAESASCDPRTLASEILAELTEEDLRDGLAVTLPAYVRVRLHASRTPVRELSSGSHVSTKVAGYAAAWRRVLDSSWEVGEQTWKRLRDLTASELRWAADRRRAQAADLQARAGWLEGLAALLAEHHVSTVGELPESVLAAYLGGQS